MPKKLKVTVTESTEQIERIRRKNLGKNEGYLKRNSLAKRNKFLLKLKEKKFHYISDISKDLNVERRTISRWIKIYQEKGIEELFMYNSRTNAKSEISPDIEKFIQEKINENKSVSYIELIKEIWRIENKKISSIKSKKIRRNKRKVIKYHTFYHAIKRIEKNFENKNEG